MISLFRTATATFLVLGGLTACAANPSVAPGTSVPVTPSGPVSTVTPESGTVAPSGPATTAPAASTPAKRPRLPKTPTDDIPAPGWTEGTVTRGGTGPCYGLVTFDGVAYAMYSAEGVNLAKGDHIRAELTPAKLRIDCGEGIPVAMGAIQHFP